MDAPPETPRSDDCYTLHGDEIEDPYLWLEESTDEVDEWVDAQNEYAESYLTTNEARTALKPAFEAAARTPDFGLPVARPSGYFQEIEHPDEEQPVLTFRPNLEDERTVLVDPNEWSDSGTASMGWWQPDPLGERIAYGVDEGGTEQFDIVILDIETGAVIDELTDLGRAMGVAWTGDGVYYIETGAADEGGQLEKSVRFHRLGDEQSADQLLRSVDEPSRWPGAVIDRDGRHLIIAESIDWERTELWYAPVGDHTLEPLLIDTEYSYEPLILGDTLYLRTNDGADRYRLVSFDLTELDGPIDPAELREVISERSGIFTGLAVANDRLLVSYEEAAISRVEVFDLSGAPCTSVNLPGDGTVTGPTGNLDASEGFLGYQSFDHPSTVFHVDPQDGSLSELDRVPIEFDTDLTVEQRWFESFDGTEVPMFVVHRRDLGFDEPAPTLMYGYGGYEISLTPGFLTFGKEFLDAGGVYVQVNLRGGGEFGKPWHNAARYDQKQRTFDDLIAAAETLIADGITASDRLAIRGGSNGGLTVGAAMIQRPDLFNAVVCQVPLLDMFRFHRFLLGDSWTSEYGSPDDPEAYGWIREYSPYHNLEDRSYPSILLTTAEGDTRVHPVHAWKMAARMQHIAEDTLVLCKTNRDTGHGTGKPTWMIVEEALDVWGFLFEQLGLER